LRLRLRIFPRSLGWIWGSLGREERRRRVKRGGGNKKALETGKRRGRGHGKRRE